MTYVSGFLVPVRDEDKERYVESARATWEFFKDYGAIGHMEAWGDNVPDGKVTDFKRSVDLQPGETVVFSWVLWPDKATADNAEKKMSEDPRMQSADMPFDGKRMIYGGFEPIFEASA